MARYESEVRITPSVLDRLIDHETGVSSEPPASRSRTLRQLKNAVRRDLEWLLNTRRSIEELPTDMEEVRNSVAVYGLPDFTAASLKSPAEQERVRRALGEVISLFEPRLRNVAVILEPLDNNVRSLRFRVEAYLQVEPDPEPVTFDTVLQVASGECQVREQE